MMATPCGPSAVPTGGAGVALPAGICSFTTALTFFAIVSSYLFTAEARRRRAKTISCFLCVSTVHFLGFLYLQKIQLHRRGPAEDRHQDTQGVALAVDLVHFAGKIRERTVDDAHRFILLERHRRPR